jgi:hypothetical protein
MSLYVGLGVTCYKYTHSSKAIRAGKVSVLFIFLFSLSKYDSSHVLHQARISALTGRVWFSE